MEPLTRAAGRYQPAAPRKDRASVQGALAPHYTGASGNDRSPSDLIPDLTNARTPLVAISFCTGVETLRAAAPPPVWKDDALRSRLPPTEALSAALENIPERICIPEAGGFPSVFWRRPLSRIEPLVATRGSVLSE